MIKIKRYFIYSIFLFLGLLPLVVFNLSGDIKDNTLAYLLNSFPDSAYAGFDNSNIIANFFTRLKHFSLMFTDSFILPLRINYFFLVFFTLSCLYGVWKSFSNKDKKNKKFPTKYLLILILLLIQSCFTVTILRVESIALITPFIFLISGKVLKDIYNKKEILAISLLILMILSNLIVLNENRKEISSVGTRRFGGWIHASDSIEEMVTYLKSRNIESPMDLTPNYVGAIIIYSNFTLKPHFCITKVLPPFDYRPCIDPDKFGYYIAYPENVDIVPIQEVIEYSKEKGFIAEIEKIFYFDNGLPEFYILHVSKEG